MAEQGVGAEIGLEPRTAPAAAEEHVLVRVQKLPPAPRGHGQAKEGVRPELCFAGEKKIVIRFCPPGEIGQDVPGIGLLLQRVPQRPAPAGLDHGEPGRSQKHRPPLGGGSLGRQRGESDEAVIVLHWQ